MGEENIIYFDKAKSELTPLEQFLIKNQPDKYKRKKPKNKKKEKKHMTEEEFMEYQNYKLGELLEDYRKNPKKYKNRKNKINKYFRKNSASSKKVKKKDMWRYNNIAAFLDFRAYQLSVDNINNQFGKKDNSNKDFMSHFSKINVGDIDFNDNRKMSLLKQLENEVIENLQSDYLFDKDRLTVTYYEEGKKQKKGKKGKFLIDELNTFDEQGCLR